MRQAGIIAAAGIYAIENHVDRLTQDHDHARILAESINNIPAFQVDLDSVATNWSTSIPKKFNLINSRRVYPKEELIPHNR